VSSLQDLSRDRRGKKDNFSLAVLIEKAISMAEVDYDLQQVCRFKARADLPFLAKG